MAAPTALRALTSSAAHVALPATASGIALAKPGFAHPNQSGEAPAPAAHTLIELKLTPKSSNRAEVSPSRAEQAAPRLDSSPSRSKTKPRPQTPAQPHSLLWACRRIWIIPLIAEAALLVGAAWLSVGLHWVIFTPGASFPIFSLGALAVICALLMNHVRVHELFMPRPVVTLGVGSLAVVAIVVGGLIMAGHFTSGGYPLLLKSLLTLVPLALFLVRVATVFQSARRAPTLREIGRRSPPRARRSKRLIARLRFWLS